MKATRKNHRLCRHDVREVLLAAVSLGLPQFINIEWLMDHAGRGTWGHSQW